MRRVCAWCRKILESEGSASEKTTHVVCLVCARELREGPLSGVVPVRETGGLISPEPCGFNRKVGTATER